MAVIQAPYQMFMTNLIAPMPQSYKETSIVSTENQRRKIDHFGSKPLHIHYIKYEKGNLNKDMKSKIPSK